MPGPASTDSPPAEIVTSPSSTVTQAFSFTWWSPSCLTGVEDDQHRSGLVAGMDDERIARARRRRDLHQIPGLHGRQG